MKNILFFFYVKCIGERYMLFKHSSKRHICLFLNKTKYKKTQSMRSVASKPMVCKCLIILAPTLMVTSLSKTSEYFLYVSCFYVFFSAITLPKENTPPIHACRMSVHAYHKIFVCERLWAFTFALLICVCWGTQRILEESMFMLGECYSYLCKFWA